MAAKKIENMAWFSVQRNSFPTVFKINISIKRVNVKPYIKEVYIKKYIKVAIEFP